jgi:hypothetical protein
MEDWVKCYSSTHSHYYYFNQKTGEKSWSDPIPGGSTIDSFISKSKTLLRSMGEQGLLEAVLQRQTTPTPLLAASALESLLFKRLSHAPENELDNTSFVGFVEMAVQFIDVKQPLSKDMMDFFLLIRVLCSYQTNLPTIVKILLKSLLETGQIHLVEKRSRLESKNKAIMIIDDLYQSLRALHTP